MGKLTDHQRKGLREFLENEGLSFKPLQDEMVDHISCDLEDRMSEGYSFEDAWIQSVGELPDSHFLIIQKEVMETINKRFALSRLFSFFALGLILISTLFKMLHLQFAGEVLLLSFAFMAVALLTTALSGIYVNKGKKGAAKVLAVILGVILMLTGFSFKILHMPGGDQILIPAVGILIISLVVNLFHIYRSRSGEGYLLTYLHQKYTPGIERFLLLLLFPVVIYRVITILTERTDFFGQVILLVVIFGAGLQFIVLASRKMEENPKQNIFTLIAIIVCFSCLILPFLGPLLPLPIRIVVIALFTPVAGWLAYTMDDGSSKPISLIMVALPTVVFLGWALIKQSIIPASSGSIFFNIPILVLLLAGVFVSKKYGMMRTFMIVSTAGYLFEYIT